MMTKPSEQQAGATIERGRWQLEWDSEDGLHYILHDGETGTEYKLTYEEIRDLRFCIGVVGEFRKRDMGLRSDKEGKDD